ncbi:hypothetical protein HYV50_03280 [Candidatus Pacearchaeota archaeon]|nr:hypothetical protein [Candidatus Pacearchaeota archaeon]
MEDKLKQLEEKRREILKKIELCKLEKERIENILQKLNFQYNIGLLNYEQYQKKYGEIFKDLTAEQWTSHYDIQLRTHKAQLEWYNEEIEKEKKNATGIREIKLSHLDERKKSLYTKIKEAEYNKKKIISFANELFLKYKNKEITSDYCEKKLKETLQNKTAQEWVDYYNNYIEQCKKQIEICDAEIRKENIKRIAIGASGFVFAFVLFTALLFLLYIYSDKLGLTGLTVELADEVHTKNVDLTFKESIEQEFTLDKQGVLNWLRVSGEIEGEGEVKIYLDDFLILDSNEIEVTGKKTITSGTITGFNVEGNEETSSSTSTDSSDSSASTRESSETTSSSEEPTDEPTPQEKPVQEEPPVEEPPKAEQPPQEELPSEEPRAEQPIEEPTVEENVTEEKPKEEKKKEELEIPVKEFKDFCKETCDLKEFDLDKTSYTLRIEITNAKLKLDKIKYEIRIEKELAENITIPAPEIPENVSEPLENITLPEENITIPPKLNETITPPTNETLINETLITPTNQTNITIISNLTANITQFKAVLGQPVKWARTINVTGPANVTIELPESAKNISVKKIKKIEGIEESNEEISEEIQEEEQNQTSIEENPSIINETSNEINETESVLEKTTQSNFENEGIPEETVNGSLITGQSIYENKRSKKIKVDINGNIIFQQEVGKKGIFFRLMDWFKKIFTFFRFTGLTVSEEQNETIEIIVEISSNESGVEVVYETPAPYAIEEDTTRGKIVQIIGPDDVHYENVLAFTNLPESLPVTNPKKIRIFWVENDSYIIPSNISDLDLNGIYDYIEWIAPQLSNQTFEIIVITKAEHLNETREFISDIYDSVRELDNNWSEIIPEAHYIRVKFERNLTKENDITLFPRTVNGTPKIEVYEINGSVLIAEFSSINDNQYNKVFLTGLGDNITQDSFDLRILNGSIELDHIIDPAEPQLTGLVSPTDTGYPLNQWIAGENVKVSDNNYANETTNGEALDTSNYSFGIPAGATINGILVKVEARHGTSCIGIDRQAVLNVSLSWNNGTSYTTEKQATWTTCTDANNTLTGLTDKWGREWDASEFSNSSFRLRIMQVACNDCQSPRSFNPGVDAIWAQVNYTLYNNPYTTLNTPTNDSTFAIDVFNITLNSTVYDLDNDTIDVLLYGVNSKETSNFYNYLLYKQLAVTNGTEITYNFTALPVSNNSNSLVLLYHFDNLSSKGENDTYSYDFSGNNNNGTFSGAVYNTSRDGGKFGYGVQFDGVNDWITQESDLGLAAYPFTFSGWAYKTGSTEGIIASLGSDFADDPLYGIEINGSGQARIIAEDNGARQSAGGTIDLRNGWHHVVGVFESNTGKSLYVDGNFVANLTTSVTFNLVTNRFRVGAEGDLFGGLYFNGTIDEVAVWNRALTANEIKNLYRLKAGKYFWKVNVTDSTSRSNESEAREFIVTDNQLKVVEPLNCDDLKSLAIATKQGYACTSAYTTCVGLNIDLNITPSETLTLNSTCNIIFNTTANDGRYSFFIHSPQGLNLTGGNVTTPAFANKFNFTSIIIDPFPRGSYGNFSFSNIRNALNITDANINFYGIDIENTTVLLNSSDTSNYTIAGGSLERMFRVNVSVYTGAVPQPLGSANVTIRNVSNAIVFNALTDSAGAVFRNLTQYKDTGSGKVYQNNHSINATKAGYVSNGTSRNITSDSIVTLTLQLIDVIEVTTTETPHDIFTRVGNSDVFNNLSDGTRPCRYSSQASINVTSTGNLILESCALEMNSTVSGQYDIEIGGRLTANYSNITSFGSFRYDFYTSTNSNLTILNSYVSNTGSANLKNRRGLTLNTNNVVFRNNTLRGADTANLDLQANGIYIQDSLFLGASSTSTDYNIYSGSNNSIVVNSNISDAQFEDIFVASGNITIRNSNYTNDNIQASGKLFREWYVDVRVQDHLNNSLSGARVIFYNNTGSLTHNITTNFSGNIIQQNVTEYTVNGTARTYQTNYTINASQYGYQEVSLSVNLTSSRNFTFTINNTIFPSITLNTPANTSVFHVGTFNITLNASVTDQFNDLVDVAIYGVNSTSTANFYKHGLLYQNINFSSGTSFTYNWTSPVTIPDNDTLVLFHFDNRKEFNESSLSDSGSKSPSDTGYPSNQWTTGENVKSSDDNYANESTAGDMLDTSNYSFSIPSGVNITGILVVLEGKQSCIGPPCGNPGVAVALSWNNGTSYTTPIEESFSSSSDVLINYGGIGNTWGRTWSSTEFSNANFRVRLNYTGNSDNNAVPRLDFVQVVLFYGGKIYDFSDKGNNGTVFNSWTTTNQIINTTASVYNVSGGKFGGAYEFDGVDDYIGLGTQAGVSDIQAVSDAGINSYPFTFSAWVKKANDTTNGVIVSLADSSTQNRYFHININSSGQALISAHNGTSTSVGGTTDLRGNWHHIVGVFKNNAQKELYVDGAFVINATTSVSFLSSTDYINIGRNGDGIPDSYFNGTIDEVAVWNRSLTATEIKNLYRLNVGKYFWKVNVTDFAGNNNESETRELTVNNTAPQITSVSSIGSISPTEGSTTNVTFYLIMKDNDGVNDLADTSVKANFTRSGEPLRQNTSCALVGDIDSTSANYSCTIQMWYFDENGVWNITVYGEDVEGLSAINTTTNFSYVQLQSLKISPAQINFAVNIGATNQTSTNDPTLINNTGNYNFTNITVNAINLHGESVSTFYIDIANFSIGNNTGASNPECGQSGATTLTNGTDRQIINTVLNRGNNSINDGSTGQEQIYYCLRTVPSTISSQIYSTSTAGSWLIKGTIALAAFALGERARRRKKKLGELSENNSLEVLDEKLKERYGTSLDELLKEKYGLGLHELLISVKRSELKIPLEIFAQEMGAAEALCKYLKENLGLRFSEIARLLNRDQRTVWINYNNAIKKKKEKIIVKEKRFAPLEIFSNRKLSILESLVYYWKEKGLRNIEIAKILDRDPRNIWTLHSRAIKKLKE